MAKLQQPVVMDKLSSSVQDEAHTAVLTGEAFSRMCYTFQGLHEDYNETRSCVSPSKDHIHLKICRLPGMQVLFFFIRVILAFIINNGRVSITQLSCGLFPC